MQERARQLRQQLTPAERRLWDRLRDDQLYGFGFRRQYPIGRFIVDFYCPAAKLAIEVDGAVHTNRRDMDTERTQWLKQHRGCRLLRFTNEAICVDIEAVLATILAAVRRPPP